jgi:hypothetical protein
MLTHRVYEGLTDMLNYNNKEGINVLGLNAIKEIIKSKIGILKI